MERLVNRTNISPCNDCEFYLLCIRKGASIIHEASKTKELASNDVQIIHKESTMRDSSFQTVQFSQNLDDLHPNHPREPLSDTGSRIIRVKASFPTSP